MERPPFEVRFELGGWALYWAELECVPGDDAPLAELRHDVCARARQRLDLETLSEDATVSALRKLFRRAGTDPTRYRPSSEALLRRILKGDDMPAVGALVDMSNCLSAELAVPCCVMADGTFDMGFVFRAGAVGEAYHSLRGPFKLEGKPLLCDTAGPLDCPITGNDRVKVTPDTERAWLVAYLPAATTEPAAAHTVLERLVGAASVVKIRRAFGSMDDATKLGEES